MFQFVLPTVSSGSAKPAETVGPGYRDSFRQEEIFLSSPPNSSLALDGPSFVDDDTVLLCADSPSQLIDKICEATRIYVDTGQEIWFDAQFRQG